MSLSRSRLVPLATLSMLIALGAFVPLGGIASAHGGIEVGDYELVIGFRNEPAYAGEPNGLDLVVTSAASEAPVTGLEKTLQVEIINGSHRQTLPVKAIWGEEGSYTANVLPTREGDYTWHVFGTIEGTPVDVSLTSSPTTFNSVQSKASISFPIIEPSTAELSAQVAAANRTALFALVVGAAGLLAGLLGVLFGLRKSAAARDTRTAVAPDKARA